MDFIVSNFCQSGAESANMECRIYNGVAFFGILLTYFPERNNPVGRRPVRETLAEIDYVGALLSITGVTLL